MYPISFRAEYVEGRSRLTTFFRLLLALPVFLVAALYGLAAYVATVIAWFAIVFTGRYPQGLYDFNAGAVRLTARVLAYYHLLTDAYPPFGAGDEPAYPVHVQVGPPLPRYSRLKTGFRFILLIPVYIVLWLYGIVLAVVPFLAWVVIVIAGRMPKAFQDLIGMAVSYQVKAMGYWMLLTETYPPVTDEPQLQAGPSTEQLPQA